MRWGMNKFRFPMTLAAFLFAASLSPAGVHLPVPYLPQPDNQTCLPTCLTMTLHFLGRSDLTSATVFRLHKRTNYDRFNLPGILKDYNLYGLPNWYELGWTRKTVEHELDLGRPVILGCNQGKYGHFVLAIGYTDSGRLIIHDPTKRAPGYEIGGPDSEIAWEDLLWRGGCIVRPEPFPEAPAISGTLVETTSPRRLAPGQEFTAEFDIRNNGREAWPGEVYLAPVVPETSPTAYRASAFRPAAGWISPERAAAPDRAGIRPGEVARFRVPLVAPRVTKVTPFLERWNLVDGNGRVFSSHWQTGPGDYQIYTKGTVEAPTTRTWTLPLEETGRDGKPALAWSTKAGAITAAKDTPATTGGAPIWQLVSPGRRYDCAWLGDPSWTDYRVEALVYCELRAAEEKIGYERVGIFLRDGGDRCGDTKDGVELGQCYAMTFDTDDGGIRAGGVDNGGIDDFRPGKRFKLAESGWHRFAIRCEGDTLTYELDGAEFWKGKDATVKSGDCGVYYKTGFSDPAKTRGIRFAEFRAVK